MMTLYWPTGNEDRCQTAPSEKVAILGGDFTPGFDVGNPGNDAHKKGAADDHLRHLDTQS